MKRQQLYFPVWRLCREDVAYALIEDGDREPHWPQDLTDEQMEAIADRMQKYLEGAMDDYWNAIRDAVDDVINRTFIQLKESA